jgi:predicted ATPase
VTFLFTDVEGSTKLLHELGAEEYAEALAEHRRALRSAFAAHGGVEVDTQGDAFFFAFPTAPGALSAAASALEGLAPSRIRVRMGLHTGTPHLAEEGYVGEDVHLGARIAAAGHGGQVLVSKETRELVDAHLTDLGEHRLKDFAEPVWIFQLGTERFPPLKTISNSNLPRPASSFVGRERELAEVTALLQDAARLVTLSGPGGSGKTRLAIEAAAELVSEFKAGVFWVGLAPVRDPALVTETIAQTLGAKDGLTEHIGERELLLLLDNLEQVVGAAPELAELVEACPNLKLLSTSRELLRVRGEVEYAVPPLSEPEAVHLFCDRAQTEADEPIAELCRRLDNLPLAVELAAARARVLSPRQILERLSKRLDLLKGGRDAEARQQTLRAAIEWSYDLLDEEEQRLFARLSVFRGGCTIDAAEELAEADIDVLQSLVDKSLVRRTGERFWMLETIREYAAERLEASDEAEGVRLRHAEFFLALAEQAPGADVSPALSANVADTSAWRERVEADYDNIRAALDWFRHSDDLEREFRLVFPITWLFLWIQGGMKEAGRMYEAVLARADDLTPVMRVDALQSLSHFGTYLDRETRRQLAEQSLALARTLGDKGRIEWSLRRLALRQDDPLEGRPMLLESEVLARDLPEKGRLAWIQQNLGVIALEGGEYEEAAMRLQESVAIFERIGGRWQATNALSCLAAVAVLEERYDDARRLLAQTLRRALELHMANHAAQCLDNFAAVSLAGGRVALAARLLAAAAATREETGDETAEDDWNYEREMRARTLARARKRLGAQFEREWEAGRALALDEAVSLALAELETDA